MVEDGAFDQPFARVVGDEGHAHRAARRHDDAVAPIGLPAIVEQVEHPQGVAMHMHGLGDPGPVDEAQGHRLPALHLEQGRGVGAMRGHPVEGPCLARVGGFALLDRQIEPPGGLEFDDRGERRVLLRRHRATLGQGGALHFENDQLAGGLVAGICAQPSVLNGQRGLGPPAPWHIEHQIEPRARAGGQGHAGGFEGLAGLAINPHDQRAHPLEPQAHEPLRAGVENPQPDPRARRRRHDLGRGLRIDGEQRPDPPLASHIGGFGEGGRDAPALVQPPVVDDGQELVIRRWIIRPIHDQEPIDPAALLFRRMGEGGGTIPIGPRIGRREADVHPLTGRKGRLRQAGRAIHPVGDPHALPVERDRLGEIVDKPDKDFFALFHPQNRAGDLPIDGPDLRFGRRCAREAQLSRPQVEELWLHGARMGGQRQQEGRGDEGATGEGHGDLPVAAIFIGGLGLPGEGGECPAFGECGQLLPEA